MGTARRPVSFERERGVYDLAVTPEIAHVVVNVGSGAERLDRVQQIFRILADQSVPVFLIKLHPTAVSFGVGESRVPEVKASLEDVALACQIEPDLALVTVVATSMRDLTGVMVDIADSLWAAGAKLYGIGDSHNSVQCLIDGARTKQALESLRRTFALEYVNV